MVDTLRLRIRRDRPALPDIGAAKTVGGLRKLKHRGLPKVDFQFALTLAAYNLMRLRILRVGT